MLDYYMIFGLKVNEFICRRKLGEGRYLHKDLENDDGGRVEYTACNMALQSQFLYVFCLIVHIYINKSNWEKYEEQRAKYV